MFNYLQRSSLKSSFGSNNFNFSRPSNGIYLKLLLASLSKKGNWRSLFKKLNSLVIKARRSNLHRLIKSQPNANFIQFQLIKLKSKIKLQRAAKISLQTAGLMIRRRLNRLFVKRNNKKMVSIMPLSSLRSIYSLFYPVVVPIELKSKRRGGRVFLVPVPVKSAKRRHSIFIRWFKQSVIEGSGASINKYLSEELSQLTFRKGKAIDRLVELEKSVKLNRVFLRKSQIKLI